MILTFVTRDELRTSFAAWEQWVNGAKEIFDFLNIEPTNCGISTFKKEASLLKYKSFEKKFEHTKTKNELINNISFYVLPTNYTTLIFDYIVKIESVMGTTYLSFNENYMSIDNLDERKIVNILKKMVPEGKGEIFLMDNRECPAMYALNMNKPDFYKTLKIISHF